MVIMLTNLKCALSHDRKYILNIHEIGFLVFTSPLFGGEIYTGNLLWTKYWGNFWIFGFPQKDYIFSTRLKIPTKFQFRYVNLYQNWRRGNSEKFNIYFLSRDSARFRFVNMIIIILKNAFIFARTFRINFWKWISVLDFPIPI